MKEYNEFIKDFNCDGILKNLSITIKDNGNVMGEDFRNETPINDFKPGKIMGVRYNDNDDFEIRYIKKSYFSNDGTKVSVELFGEIELELLLIDKMN